MTQVFVSYSRKDIEFIERLVNDLEYSGLTVWYDLSGLDGGTQWGTEIQKAIRNSQYFLIVLSPNSLESKWVQREFLYAESIDIKVIPLLYLPCELPMWLLDLQLIDLQGKNYEPNFDRVLKALGAQTRAERLQAQQAFDAKTRLEEQEKDRRQEEERHKQLDQEKKRLQADQDDLTDRNKARLEKEAKERREKVEQQRQQEADAKAHQRAEDQKRKAQQKINTLEFWKKWKPAMIRVGGLGILLILVVFIGIQLFSGRFGPSSPQTTSTMLTSGTKQTIPSKTVTMPYAVTLELTNTPSPSIPLESSLITDINNYISQVPPTFEDDFSTPNPAWGYDQDGVYIPNLVKTDQLELRQTGDFPINGLFKAEDFILQYELYPQELGVYETKIHVTPEMGGSSTYYDLIISPSNQWNLNYYGNNLGTVMLAGGDVMNSRGGSIYQLRIIVKNKQLVVFINDNLCAAINNLKEPEGIDNYLVLDGSQLYLDNVKFWNLDGVDLNP